MGLFRIIQNRIGQITLNLHEYTLYRVGHLSKKGLGLGRGPLEVRAYEIIT
jgi:hypothetical protein